MDGSQVGELEGENLMQLLLILKNGKIVHLLCKRKNGEFIIHANEFIALLPQNETPELTEGYEGFLFTHI